MLYRFFRLTGDGYAEDSDFMYLLPYADRADIADYALEPVMWCTQAGIAAGAGDDCFDPLGTCTRAQFVSFLYRWAADNAA